MDKKASQHIGRKMTESVISVTRCLAKRYSQILEMNLSRGYGEKTFLSYDKKTSLKNLKWMCEIIDTHAEDYPIDKLSRWLGFIQGVLAAKGFINVDDERNFSRPLFHEAYSSMGIKIPETKELKV